MSQKSLPQLTYNDFMLHSFAYAGKGIEQDIICQLLLPPKSRQSRLETQSDRKTTSSNPWQWQPSIPGLDQMRWQSLGLEELELPRVGEPDITARIRLQQRLESSLLGQAVLDAALALKLILQHQESFTLELADQQWILTGVPSPSRIGFEDAVHDRTALMAMEVTAYLRSAGGYRASSSPENGWRRSSPLVWAGHESSLDCFVSC